MNTAILAAIRIVLTGVRRRGAALSRSGIIGCGTGDDGVPAAAILPARSRPARDGMAQQLNLSNAAGVVAFLWSRRAWVCPAAIRACIRVQARWPCWVSA